ncbi:MAG TPA: preprotein translocase subunit YajC [Stellaceae bacterium]|nr:preprotein translocase subunit YajC [Stellaceae bacterium]
MLISPAYAQGTGLMDQSAVLQFLPLVLIFVVFYFLLIRPQQTKQKQHKSMLEALRRGDRVVTGGGILATVARVVNPDEVELDLAPNVRVRVMRSTITSVLAKTEPVAARESARERDREKEKDPARIEAKRRAWREVLQLQRERRVSIDRVEEQYQKLARERHPDNGGSDAMMVELNDAREDARKELMVTS